MSEQFTIIDVVGAKAVRKGIHSETEFFAIAEDRDGRKFFVSFKRPFGR